MMAIRADHHGAEKNSMFTLQHTSHDEEIRRRISSLIEAGQEKGGVVQPWTANASISPVQVSIEGLARHAVSLHVRQAGSSKLRNDDLTMNFCCEYVLSFNPAK
jgi:hypothetical protein